MHATIQTSTFAPSEAPKAGKGDLAQTEISGGELIARRKARCLLTILRVCVLRIQSIQKYISFRSLRHVMLCPRRVPSASSPPPAGNPHRQITMV